MGAADLAFSFRGAYAPAVSRAYLSRKLTRPLVTKDGGTLRTVLDARAYMLGLSKGRERSARWQRAAQLLLAKADVGAVSRQLELALLYDGKLDERTSLSASMPGPLTAKASSNTSPASRTTRLRSPPIARRVNAGPARPSPCGKVRE